MSVIAKVPALAVSPERDREVLDEIKDLVVEMKHAYVRLGALLHEVQQRKSYKKLGHKTFDEYCEQELGFKGSKGYYLASVHRRLVIGAGVSEDQVKEIDWSAAREIASLPDEELEDGKAKKWIDRAKKIGHRELVKEVKEVKGQNPNHSSTIRKMFALFPEQFANVKAALEAAGIMCGSTKEGHCLDMICLEYLTTRLETSETSVTRILSEVERVYGVNCVAVKVKGKKEEIVHGEEFAQEVGVE